MHDIYHGICSKDHPSVRDFRGVNPNAFDGRGNYALGIKEQIIFPEIEYDKVDKVRGMDIIFVLQLRRHQNGGYALAFVAESLHFLLFHQVSDLIALNVAIDLPHLEVVACIGRGGQDDLGTEHGFCIRG